MLEKIKRFLNYWWEPFFAVSVILVGPLSIMYSIHILGIWAISLWIIILALVLVFKALRNRRIRLERIARWEREDVEFELRMQAIANRANEERYAKEARARAQSRHRGFAIDYGYTQEFNLDTLSDEVEGQL